MGVDYVEFSPNPIIRRKLNRIGLMHVGDIFLAGACGAYLRFPSEQRRSFNTPLIIWGENSQNEYGGPAGAKESSILNRLWLEEFGGLLGLRVSDLVGMDDIEAKHLIAYTYPSDNEFETSWCYRSFSWILYSMGWIFECIASPGIWFLCVWTLRLKGRW